MLIDRRIFFSRYSWVLDPWTLVLFLTILSSSEWVRPISAGIAKSPRWEYCGGKPTVPENLLYEEPFCDVASLAIPLYSNSIIQYEAYQVKNLDFCCKANYTALLPAYSDIDAIDAEAEALYLEAKNKMIDRFDCTSFYPYHSCEPCLYAYRTWLCAVHFPMKCSNAGRSNTTALGAVRVCDFVCLEVMRKCPAEFGFDCPIYAESGLYAVWQPELAKSDVALGPPHPLASGGCNRMQLEPQIRSSASFTVGGARKPRNLQYCWGALLTLLLLIYLGV